MLPSQDGRLDVLWKDRTLSQSLEEKISTVCLIFFLYNLAKYTGQFSLISFFFQLRFYTYIHTVYGIYIYLPDSSLDIDLQISPILQKM